MRATLLNLALGVAVLGANLAAAQEATSGIDLRATLSGQLAASSVATEDPRLGSPALGGYRAIVYPTFKLNEHWAITAALQSYSRPYFLEDFSSSGYGVKDQVLQASLNYARVSDNGSLLIRAGELPTSFGSFVLHYDDADNSLVGIPLQNGYYDKPVSTLGLLAVQVDTSRGKWDGRLQFANSSPANPRSVFASDQYGNWAGGGGYTIRQGFRVGFSAYRGPFLNRDSDDFAPGEVNPSRLPAHGLGVDAAYAHGHWDFRAEMQSFARTFRAMPEFHAQAGYLEAKRVLSPRLYLAGRAGYYNTTESGSTQTFEGAAGIRPTQHQLLKISYELDHNDTGSYPFEKTFTIQLVTSFHLYSYARN